MQSENSTTKTFDKIKLLLQNLFDIAYLAFCYTSMFPRSILWSRLCLTKLNVRLHLLIFEHNFLMSIVMSLLRWWCSAKSKVFKILLTMAYKKQFSCSLQQQHQWCKKITLLHKIQHNMNILIAKEAAVSFLLFLLLLSFVLHHLCLVRRSSYKHAKSKWIEFQHSLKGMIKREKSESMRKLPKHLSLDQLFCRQKFETLDMSSILTNLT